MLVLLNFLEEFMPIQLIETKIHKSHLAEVASERFDDLVKAVVDIKRRIMVIGAEIFDPLKEIDLAESMIFKHKK